MNFFPSPQQSVEKHMLYEKLVLGFALLKRDALKNVWNFKKGESFW